MAKLIDLKGQEFGRLVVLEQSFGGRARGAMWLCRCQCGNSITVRSVSLRNGDTKSCGCLNKELTIKRSLTHGHSKGGKVTPEYRSWEHMLNRCDNPNNQDYPDYGGRGIKVCDRWRKFENFYADIGDRPSSTHSIERLDVNGNYEPSNCVWGTTTEQSRNTRVRKDSGTGVKGVHFRTDNNKYRVSITVNYKRIYLGQFDTIEEAIKARKEAELKYWGESS